MTRGQPRTSPAEQAASPADVAVIVPVNAQTDVEPALALLGDLQGYDGPLSLDFVFVLNNYAAGETPEGMDRLREAGARVVAIPDVRRSGYSVGIVARSHGVRATSVECCILFDADCRVPNPTSVIDWYARVLDDGASAAYTSVRHNDLSSALSVRVRVGLHHTARWAKRSVFSVPTIRGSNYAVRRTTFLRLFDAGLIVHDMNVGPAVRAAGQAIAYSGKPEHVVFTSARFLRPGWRRLIRYVPKRVRYNVKMLWRQR